MLLMRDLLDKQVMDRNRTKLGKVDGVVLKLSAGKPPAVTHIEMGSVALARRISPGFGRLWSALARWAGGPDRAQPFRIAWRDIRDAEIEVVAELTQNETPLFDWQIWLRQHIIGKIPGA